MTMNEKRRIKVFLCHAHADQESVRALYKHLTNNCADAWLDKENIIPGQDWELEIRKAVRDSDIVVVCISKQFNRAGFRQKEVRLALDVAMEKPEGDIYIIPARLENCETPENLKKWHWVDLFEGDGYKKIDRALSIRAQQIGLEFPCKEKAPIYIINIMNKVVITVEANISIAIAQKKMRENQVHYLLIKPSDKIKHWRIFTESDLLLALEQGSDSQNIYISDFCSTVKYFAQANWTPQKTLEYMVNHGIKIIPVADGEGNIIGTIGSNELRQNF